MRRWGARALGRWAIRAALTASCTAAPLLAQRPEGLRPVSDSSSPPQRPSAPAPALVRYGKWATLGGSIYLGVLAQQRHSDANDAYDALQRACDASPPSCALTNGHYVDPGNERLYQETRRLDHDATRFLIGAETLFAASAAGFIWELIAQRPEPRNIPLHPRLESYRTTTRLSLTIPF